MTCKLKPLNATWLLNPIHLPPVPATPNLLRSVGFHIGEAWWMVPSEWIKRRPATKGKSVKGSGCHSEAASLAGLLSGIKAWITAQPKETHWLKYQRVQPLVPKGTFKTYRNCPVLGYLWSNSARNLIFKKCSHFVLGADQLFLQLRRWENWWRTRAFSDPL